MAYEDDSDDEGCDLCCPSCGIIIDAFDLYVENRGHEKEGSSACPSCGEDVPDGEWITD
jgi:hypothetical protein